MIASFTNTLCESTLGITFCLYYPRWVSVIRTIWAIQFFKLLDVKHRHTELGLKHRHKELGLNTDTRNLV